jgi:hypothetical protein
MTKLHFISTLDGVITGTGATLEAAIAAAKQWGGHDKILPATPGLVDAVTRNGDVSWDETHGLAHLPLEINEPNWADADDGDTWATAIANLIDSKSWIAPVRDWSGIRVSDGNRWIGQNADDGREGYFAVRDALLSRDPNYAARQAERERRAERAAQWEAERPRRELAARVEHLRTELARAGRELAAMNAENA